MIVGWFAGFGRERKRRVSLTFLQIKRHPTTQPPPPQLGQALGLETFKLDSDSVHSSSFPFHTPRPRPATVDRGRKVSPSVLGCGSTRARLCERELACPSRVRDTVPSTCTSHNQLRRLGRRIDGQPSADGFPLRSARKDDPWPVKIRWPRATLGPCWLDAHRSSLVHYQYRPEGRGYWTGTRALSPSCLSDLEAYVGSS